MFAETLRWPEDCIGHESNCTLSGPQSSGVMRHRGEERGNDIQKVGGDVH